MLAANKNNLLIGAGRLFFDRFDTSGNPTGFRFLGDVKKLSITSSVTTKEYYTSTKATRTKLANVPVDQKHTMAIEMGEFAKENVALALLGDAGVYTQTMTTVASGSETIAGGAGQAPLRSGVRISPPTVPSPA